ncbi:MAG: BatA and WFA domain-containing protein, partial [Sedimentisphaerales bacterium]|nr:BatA and WFA domain-containing protein [Sedimentisphaerales bacterium]
MSFALPGLLWFLPAALLPVLFHFLFPRKSGKLIFPTLMFFYRADPQIARRNRLRQWLILLCRVLVLFFLILALSRPTIMVGKIPSLRANNIIILDDSASMARPGKLQPHRNCFNIASAAALSLIERSGSENLGIITLSDARYYSADGDLPLRELLAGHGPTAASGNMALALEKGGELLVETGGTIHIFSDCQSHEFGTVGPEFLVARDNVNISIHLIPAQLSEQANVVVKSVEMPAGVLLPGHPNKAEIILENNSLFDASDITVTVAGVSGWSKSETVALKAGAIRPVPFQLPGAATGFHPLAITLSGDGFTADNQAAGVWYCHEPVKVLFAGGRSDFGLIPLALSPLDEPALTGIEMAFRSPDKIVDYCQQETVAMLVLTIDISIELEKTVPGWQKEYSEAGGNILLVPAISAKASGQELPEYYGISLKPRVNNSVALPLELSSPDSLFWYRLFGAGSQLIDKVSIGSYFPLEFAAEWQSLLICDLNQSVLAYRPLGKGNIFVSGFALDNSSSTLPKTPLMVVILQNMVTTRSPASSEGMVVKDGRILNLYAGDALRQINITGPVNAISLSGITMVDQSGELTSLPIITQSGVLLLDHDGGTMAVSFSADPAES